jgi:hypothetical protein
MSMIPASDDHACTLGSAPVFDLDAARLGEMVLRLGALAHALGHADVSGTVSPYLRHPEILSAEGQFLGDLFCRPVPEIVDRWYGGGAEAAHMVAAVMASELG